MKFLVDTHTVFWAVTGSSALSTLSRELIAHPENEPLVSASSAWEVATKVRIGRWPDAELFEKEFQNAIRLAGYTVLEISVEHALLAGRLSGAHKDPFDRMLAAQALIMGIPILSRDEALDSFGITRIW